MPEFAWKAAKADGALASGTLAAPSRAAAVEALLAQRLRPLQISEAGMAQSTSGGPSWRALTSRWRLGLRRADRVTAADILGFSSELSIMLRSGLTLANALRILIDMSHKPAMAALVSGLLDAVKKGASLSKAMEARRAEFGDFYINMVRAGEASGQLGPVLQRVVEHLERMRALRDSLVSATLYPAILLGVSVLSLMVMLGFVVPQFETLFKGAGDLLPWPTRVVMTVGRAFSDYGAYFVAGAFLLGAVLSRWIATPAGRLWGQRVLLTLPLAGRILRRYQLALYSRSMGTLLGNGVPMLAALRIAEDTVTVGPLRQLLAPVPAKVKEGAKIADALAGTGAFEPLAIGLMRVGDETGRIGAMMSELAAILDREVETGIRRALTVLEPMLILVLGIAIAAIIVSILLGILSINELAV